MKKACQWMLEREIPGQGKELNKFTEEIQKEGKSTKHIVPWLILSFLKKSIVIETAGGFQGHRFAACDSANNAHESLEGDFFSQNIDPI